MECESACRAGQMGPHDHMHMGPHDYMHMGPHDYMQMGPHDHMHMGPHDYMHMGPHDYMHIGPHDYMHIGPHDYMHMGPHDYMHMGPHDYMHMGPHDYMHMGPHDYMHMGPHDSCSHPTEGKGAGCGDEHALQGREGRVRGGGMMIKVATPVTHHQGGHSGYPPIRSGFKHFGFGGFKDPTHCEWGLDRPLTWVPLPPNPPTH